LYAKIKLKLERTLLKRQSTIKKKLKDSYHIQYVRYVIDKHKTFSGMCVDQNFS